MSRELDLPSELRGISTSALRGLRASMQATHEGDRRRALEELDAALAHDPELPAARLLAAQIRAAHGQHQRALDELDLAARHGAARPADELRDARATWSSSR